MKTIKRILVPTDFSEFSLAGMDYVISLSVLYDAQIFLLNVIDHEPTLTFHTVDLHSETLLRDNTRKAEAYLSTIIKQKFQDMKNILPMVRHGDPARVIVKVAREEGVDLIIMATHGRTGFAHVLLGSVAEKVVRHSSIPVLTVKPEEMSENVLREEDVEEQLHLRL